MPEAGDRSTPSRREFLKLAAAAGLAGALPPVAALAQTPTPPVTAAPPAAPETPSDSARALVAVLQARLGKDRLSPEQWESVAKDFDADLATGKRLAGVRLANGDEPDFAFEVTP